MIVRDGRNVEHDLGPQRARALLSHGGSTTGFVPETSWGSGFCPLCGIKMWDRGIQRACIKTSAPGFKGKRGYRKFNVGRDAQTGRFF